MKKILLFVIPYLMVALSSNAQSPIFKWAKQIGGTYEVYSNAITSDASGNVYITGSFDEIADFNPGVATFNMTSFDSSGDIFISKLDESGNFVWAKCIGGAEYDEAMAIALDKNGNIYLTGSFSGNVDFDPGSGIFNLTTVQDNDIFILKLDASGNFVWARSLGGTDYDKGQGIAVDASFNVFITGSYYGTVDFNPGSGTFDMTADYGDDIFILKLDASGNFIWAKNLGGTGNTDKGMAITTDNAGNVYSTGIFGGTNDFDPGAATFELTSAGIDDIFVSKLDGSGNFVWAKRMGGDDDDWAHSLALDASGNIIIGGSFEGTSDFDPGTALYSLTTTGYENTFIAKLDASGNFIWARSIGGSVINMGLSMALDGSGSVYSTGFFIDTTDFDPGVAMVNLISEPDGEAFILKWDAAGNFVWAEKIGSTSSAIGTAITVDANYNIYTTGSFNWIGDFDPGSGELELTPIGYKDIYIHKMSQAISGIKDSDLANFNIYPNPTKGVFNVNISNPADNTTIEVYNIIGALVYKTVRIGEIATVDLSCYANGLYIVKVKSDGQIIATQKIIKNSGSW